MSSTGVDPAGAVRVSVEGSAGVAVRVSTDWRERLAFAGGGLGAAVVAAFLTAVARPGDSSVGLSPVVEGESVETLCAVVLDVADRLLAAAAPRTLFRGEPVAVTLTAGAVSGVDLDPRWLADATVEEIGRQVGAALGRALAVTDRRGDPVLVEACRLGADPVGLMRAGL
jgi:hypothetical protein